LIVVKTFGKIYEILCRSAIIVSLDNSGESLVIIESVDFYREIIQFVNISAIVAAKPSCEFWQI
jgi:hypothetical protein